MAEYDRLQEANAANEDRSGENRHNHHGRYSRYHNYGGSLLGRRDSRNWMDNEFWQRGPPEFYNYQDYDDAFVE